MDKHAKLVQRLPQAAVDWAKSRSDDAPASQPSSKPPSNVYG